MKEKPNKLDLIKLYIKIIFIKCYFYLKFPQIINIVKFLLHRYDAKQFKAVHIKDNAKILLGLKRSDLLDANSEGKLFKLTSKSSRFFFYLKDILLFGAYSSLVKKAVFFSFVGISLEIYNPFNKKTLEVYLGRKISLLKRMLEKLPFEKEKFNYHIESFLRSSLLQQKIVQEVTLAVKKQKRNALIENVQSALKKGIHPILATSGCSGAYWMRNTEREIVGLFKPFDEEIHAPNNPLGPAMQGALGQRIVRRGTCIGEAAHKEVAAFIVDAFFGFGLVPKTYYASFTHSVFFLAKEERSGIKKDKKKLGSFQEFLEDFSPLTKIKKEEWKTISAEDYQLLVLLDMIVGNLDRNSGNILVNGHHIAAIDHGLCFPDSSQSLSTWYWKDFEQGQEKLNAVFFDLLIDFPFERLSEKLRTKCFISIPALNRMRERVVLFREGVKAHLTIAQLSELLTEDFLAPLKDFKDTLEEKAQEQVKILIDF